MNKQLILMLLAVGAVCSYPAEQYTTKFDNIDFEEVLKSDRLLNKYTNCLMEKGKCTPDGKELKANLPDALQTGCSKCSETQKRAGYKIVDFLIDNKPDIWSLLESKYDPEGIYSTKYKSEIEQRKEKA